MNKFVNSIKYLIIFCLLGMSTTVLNADTKRVESDEKCYIDYIFKLDEGTVSAHFGRWATPEFAGKSVGSQDLCRKDSERGDNIEPANID